MKIRIAAIALLACLVVQALFSMAQKSVTVDEIMYIAAGDYHLRTGDFQMNMTNPPLVKAISALPLRFLSPSMPDVNTSPASWSATEEWQYARAFLYENQVAADTLLFWARIPIILFGLLTGFLLFGWVRRLYGDWAGLFSLFLFSFSPTILAHTRLATQDIGLTLFMFGATYFFWQYANQPRWRSLVLCGVLFGAAIVTKSVGFFLLPVFGLYAVLNFLQDSGRLVDPRMPVVRRILPEKRRLRQLVTTALFFLWIGLISLVVVNLTYGFQGFLRPFGETLASAAGGELPVREGPVGFILDLAQRLPVPLPAPFVRSLLFQFQLTAGSGNVFFAGQIYPDGLWYLMPVSFLLKTPIPSLLLLLATLIFLGVRRNIRDAELLALVFIAVTVLVFTVFSNVNVGVRYLLPIYPFVFLLAGKLVSDEIQRPRWVYGGLTLLLVWYLAGALFTYPHYLPYFNEFVGGSENGYRYLADSNVDWGQDLKALKQYLDQHEIDKIKLGYFGSADARYYEIDYDYLPSVGLAPRLPGELWWYEMDPDNPPQFEPAPGVYAVSANLLASPGWMYPLFHESYAWFDAFEPVDQVGHSILIFHIEDVSVSVP